MFQEMLLNKFDKTNTPKSQNTKIDLDPLFICFVSKSKCLRVRWKRKQWCRERLDGEA